MFSLKRLQLPGGRAGGTGHHLVDPHGEPVAADRGNGKGRQQHGGQKEKREDFHAPAARPSAPVVACGRHDESRFRCDSWIIGGSGAAAHVKTRESTVKRFDLDQ